MNRADATHDSTGRLFRGPLVSRGGAPRWYEVGPLALPPMPAGTQRQRRGGISARANGPRKVHVAVTVMPKSALGRNDESRRWRSGL